MPSLVSLFSGYTHMHIHMHMLRALDICSTCNTSNNIQVYMLPYQELMITVSINHSKPRIKPISVSAMT